MQEHNLDTDKLKQALARQGLTLEEYREGMKKQLTKMKIIQLKVKSRVQVTDQDVKSTIAQRTALDANEYRVRARHILFLVPSGEDGKIAEAKARTVLARLQKGETFEALAKELSEDPGSRDRGGSLGEFGRGEMVPEFERVAFQTEPGNVAGPVRTAFGFHVIEVQERVVAKGKTATDLEEDIRRRLFENEVELQFRAYLDELKKNAHIEKRI